MIPHARVTSRFAPDRGDAATEDDDDDINRRLAFPAIDRRDPHAAAAADAVDDADAT